MKNDLKQSIFGSIFLLDQLHSWERGKTTFWPQSALQRIFYYKKGVMKRMAKNCSLSALWKGQEIIDLKCKKEIIGTILVTMKVVKEQIIWRGCGLCQWNILSAS